MAESAVHRIHMVFRDSRHNSVSFGMVDAHGEMRLQNSQ